MTGRATPNTRHALHDLAQALDSFKSSLCEEVDLGGLFARSKVAHKWKAPFRSVTLREGIAWRTHDLLAQSLLLHQSRHTLGARILARSALETIAVLIYLNQQTRKVLSGSLSFHDFSRKTSVLLLGSRDKSTDHAALSIVTVLQKCNARYPGIEELYAGLSESAHPNYEGVCIGYSKVDHDNFVTQFSNRWEALYATSHLDKIALCLEIFYTEYNEEWPDAFQLLESWIVENDAMLEATKSCA